MLLYLCMRKFKLFKYKFSKTIHYAKTYLYLMVCVIGAMSLASCSEDSISPDAGGDGDGDSTTEVPLAQVAKPKPNPWLAQEEYSITHFNSAQTDAFSSAVKDGTFNIDLS